MQFFFNIVDDNLKAEIHYHFSMIIDNETRALKINV